MRIRDEFLPKAALYFPDTISGIDALTRDAIDFKFMQAPLSAEQWAHFIQIPAAPVRAGFKLAPATTAKPSA